MTEILVNATVDYIDGIEEYFEAIQVTDKGVIVGRTFDGKIVFCGFISKKNIKQIKNGSKRKA